MIVGGIFSPAAYFFMVSNATGPKKGLHSQRAAELAVDDGLNAVLLAVDGDDQDVLARLLAGGLDGRDGAQRHLVVVGIDDGRVGMGLQQRLRHLAALVAGEVARLARHDLVAAPAALMASSKPFLRSLAGEEPVVPSSSMILPLPPVFLIVHSATRWPSLMKSEPMKAR